MKHIISILLFTLLLPSYASDDNSLVIYLNSGTKILFPVKDNPQITFEDNLLCINTERYHITDVKKYVFSKNEEVSIQGVEGDNKSNVRLLDGERIVINAKDSKASVRIYSSNGIEHKVKSEKQSDGSIVVSMSGLAPDTYIIAVGDETIKIRKR